MTSRERILAACAHEPTDHVPLHLEVHPSYLTYDPSVARWQDQFERTDDLLALGTDAMVEVWLPDPSFHPDVRVRQWKEADGVTGASVLYKEYETPAGILRQAIRETEDLYSWHKINRNTRGPLADLIDGVGLLEDVNPSRSVEFLIKCPGDLERMRYLFQPLSGMALDSWREDALYAKREAQKRQAVFLARRTYCGSAMLWLTDAEEAMCTFASDPEFIAEFLRIIQDWQIAILGRVLEIGVDMVTRFGYYDTPDFWGRNYFQRYLKPLMDEEGEIVHQAGALLSQQQSEGVTQLADIYRTMKVDVFRDIDPVQGGEDLARLKRELGDVKTLMGGINCDVMLANASPEEIHRVVRETLELMSPGGGFILHPIPGIYAGVPWKKVLCMVEAWKEYA
ncbi:MAG: uroporphyrinogen decarboxylase family protein [Planctomycetota bacterium]